MTALLKFWAIIIAVYAAILIPVFGGVFVGRYFDSKTIAVLACFGFILLMTLATIPVNRYLDRKEGS